MASDVGQNETNSAQRIVVRCLSHRIPGPRRQRIATLTDIVCRDVLQRGVDTREDFITCIGLDQADGKKVKLLVETGATSATPSEIPVKMFKWNGQELRTSLEANSRTCAYLAKVPFKYKPPERTSSSPKSMSEMREGMNDEEWNAFMQQIVLRKFQYKERAGTAEREWALGQPALLLETVQQYVSQQRWYKLAVPPELSKSLQGLKAAKGRDTKPDTLVTVLNSVLDTTTLETVNH